MVFVLFILLVLDMEVRKDEKFVYTLHIVSITCNNEVCLLEYNKKEYYIDKKGHYKEYDILHKKIIVEYKEFEDKLRPIIDFLLNSP